MPKIILLFFFVTSPLIADIRSTTGQIKFDVQNDQQAEMTLNSTGLGVGVTPSTNLHISGNAVISNQLFVGGDSGSSNLNINRTIGFGFQMVTSSTTLNENSIVLADTSAGNIVLSLPEASSYDGRKYIIKKTSTLNKLFIRDGGFIDNYSDITLSVHNMGSLSVLSYSGNWHILDINSYDDLLAIDNLVGWWKLDETSGTVASDSSQNNHHGTYTNTSSTNLGTNGIINTTYSFDGVDDFVEIPNHEDFRGMSELTLSVWIYAHSKSNFDRILVKSDNNAGNRDRAFRLMLDNTGRLRFMCFNQSQTLADIYEDGAFSLNTWIHLVGLYDGTNTYMYINGEAQSDVSNLTGTIYDDSGIENTVIIGGGENNDSYAFDGLIDDVRIYNRALTDSEIMALFNQGQ